jgi:hypothetical protein
MGSSGRVKITPPVSVMPQSPRGVAPRLSRTPRATAGGADAAGQRKEPQAEILAGRERQEIDDMGLVLPEKSSVAIVLRFAD